jgi:uncharacterized protein (UPF0276 family)
MSESFPLVGLSLMPEEYFCQAALPLFESESVSVVEWSFDTIVTRDRIPEWLEDILAHYGQADRLLGHGVRYSLLSAEKDAYHQQWLELAGEALTWHSYHHVTEHFGFMTGGDFHRSAPMPVPLIEESLLVGQLALEQLLEVCQVPIGVENLALALSPEDVLLQGEFLAKLLEPSAGFVLLDLHNLYCQSCNFSYPLEELLKLYPIELVKEVHISGGSWSEVKFDNGSKSIRRDTHNGSVPEELFHCLGVALDRFPNIEFIIFEQLGTSLGISGAQQQFQNDFRRIGSVVSEWKERKVG